MNYDRVVGASVEGVTVSLIDDPVMELRIPANGYAEIIRVEIGVAEGADPLAESQELAFFTATGDGTGGSANTTEAIIRGSGTILGSVQQEETAAGAGLVEHIQPGFHWSIGHLYLPVPEERYQLVSGGQDHFGFYFPTAPDAATTFSARIVWGEVG
jgi:hypothetical protein